MYIDSESAICNNCLWGCWIYTFAFDNIYIVIGKMSWVSFQALEVTSIVLHFNSQFEMDKELSSYARWGSVYVVQWRCLIKHTFIFSFMWPHTQDTSPSSLSFCKLFLYVISLCSDLFSFGFGSILVMVQSRSKCSNLVEDFQSFSKGLYSIHSWDFPSLVNLIIIY